VARLIGWLVFLALIGAAYWFGRDYVRRHPQDVPWTSLELAHPIGAFTGRKLAALGDRPAECRALLGSAGVEHAPVPPRRDGADCGYADGMRLAGGDVRYAPAGVVTSCPVAAAMHLLEERIIQPAAMRHLGSRVVAVDHAGSYSCRRLYGRSEGPFSEHATADALDVTGFRLADRRRVSVLGDWSGEGAKAAFLRDVRDGACRLFGTVLSPDYNAAHADHLHLDQAQRGRAGWRLCR
jgi:hypothetical protein